MEEISVNLLNKEAEWPEPLLHHIMSFLTVKQSVKASVLSKTWLKAWHTCPVFQFNDMFLEKDLFYGVGSRNRLECITEEIGRKREKILKSLDSTLRNREKQTDKYIHKLAIDLSLSCDCDLNELIDKWVCHAIESNVKDLKLAFALFGEPYVLPQSLFSAKSICVLELTGCSLELPRNRVELCFLRNLCLKESSVSDGVIESLIAGCPSIEDVSVDSCGEITRLKLLGPDKLRKIKLKNIFDLQRLEIGGNVESMSIYSFYTFEIHVASCKTLKSLTLDCPILDEWLLNQISELNQLEHLSLYYCSRSNNIRISSLCLKTLIIHGSSRLTSIKIETPNLREFTYRGKLIHLSSNALSLSKANILILPHQELYVQTTEFIQFLENFCHSNVVCVGSCRVEHAVIPVAFREIRPSPLIGVKHLKFYLSDALLHPYETFPIVRVVDGLLWIAPHAETVSIDCCSYNKSCFTFLYKRHLAADCCKSLPVSCWRHCIKEVEIVNSITLEEGKIVKRYVLQEEDMYEKIIALKDMVIS